jgi:bacterioferritin
LLETHQHDIGDILRESLGHEKATLKYYEDLLGMVEGDDVITNTRRTARTVTGARRP